MRIKLSLIFTIILLFFIPSSFAEEEWHLFEVKTDNGQFRIPVKIINGTVSEISGTSDILLIKMSSEQGGKIEISIPHNFFAIYSKTHSSIHAFVDGSKEIVGIELNKNECFKKILIEFDKVQNQIEVMASSPLSVVRNEFQVQPIYLYSNQQYKTGNIAKVEGCTSLALDKGDIIIDISDQEGNVAKSFSITPEIDGTFSKEVIIDGQPDKTYSIYATYGNYTAVPEFPLVMLMLVIAIIPTILFSRKFYRHT